MAIVTNVPTPMIAYMMEGTAVLYKRSSSPTRICFARTVPATPITLRLVEREKQESRHVDISSYAKNISMSKYFLQAFVSIVCFLFDIHGRKVLALSVMIVHTIVI